MRTLLESTFAAAPAILMEGALGERLKREHGLKYDPVVDMAGFVYDGAARRALQGLWSEYMDIALRHRLPVLAMTPTRRANKERIARSSYSDAVFADTVQAFREVQTGYGGTAFIGGTMGCKGDAYLATEVLSESAAEAFHVWSAERFAAAGADFLYGALMPALSEAAGLARACAGAGIPYIVSFMIGRNGALVDGTSIHDAIARIDDSVRRRPLCYMVNCVHPTIAAEALARSPNRTELVRTRLRGIQANASALAPEELDGSALLHGSAPDALARDVFALRAFLDLQIAGGCCGTDGRHIEAMAAGMAADDGG